jgi:hypothetical protein
VQRIIRPLTSVPKFAVTHNAAFLTRTKASFVTPSRAKSLPSGIIEVACDGEGNPDESVCASVAGVPLPAIAKLLNFSIAFGS